MEKNKYGSLTIKMKAIDPLDLIGRFKTPSGERQILMRVPA
jgi:hypothetical protein